MEQVDIYTLAPQHFYPVRIRGQDVTQVQLIIYGNASEDIILRIF